MLALGLKKETADMYYELYGNGEHDIYPIMLSDDDIKKGQGHYGMAVFIPAWSLHRLLNLLPHKYGEYCVFANCYMWYNNHHLDIAEQFDGSNQYEYIINCIEWLIKEGYFNKEYLCEK